MATTDSVQLTSEELQLATRNHGMPLEALRYDVTPIGLHYLLIHYDIPVVDPTSWRLRLGGLVETPIELSLDDIRARKSVSRTVTMECAGNGRTQMKPRPMSQPWVLEAVGTGTWTGTPLADVLQEAGVQDEACEVVFTGLDRGVEGGVAQQYQRSLPVADVLQGDALLAYELNGVPLPPQHGFPLRLVVPGWYGMTSVKWLTSIEAVSEPFAGFYQAVSYRFRQDADEPGDPVTRMAVRSLMAPPGIPDFYTRRRLLEPGPVQIQGRAWSGSGPIVAVEVSADDGVSWHAAEVTPGAEAHAWSSWRWRWEPPGPGDYVLACRATDTTGAQQPDAPSWNLGGYANNAIQRVPVTVAASA